MTTALLADAFQHDPLMRWFEPDPHRRPARLRRMFAALQRRAHQVGGTVELPGAAALWVPAALAHPGPWGLLRSGMLLLPLTVGMAGLHRIQRHEADVLTRITAMSDAAYLWIVGVDPARQGTGLGRAILEAAFAQMNAAGFRRCVLKTENRDNVAFYQRLGFTLLHHQPPDEQTLELWLLERPLEALNPRSAQG